MSQTTSKHNKFEMVCYDAESAQVSCLVTIYITYKSNPLSTKKKKKNWTRDLKLDRWHIIDPLSDYDAFLEKLPSFVRQTM
jgi:hypothetical protein